MHGWYEAINIDPGSVDGDIGIYNNILVGQGTPIKVYGAGTINGDINIYNNTILSFDDLGVANNMRFTSSILAAGQYIRIKNNIIGCTTPLALSYMSTPATITGTFECDYDLYWNTTNTTDPFYSLGVAKTWAEWLALGYEVNTPNVTLSLDPLFPNGSGLWNLAGDFALQTGSPAINVGVDTGITTDFYGNPRVGNYDLGAIEKQ